MVARTDRTAQRRKGRPQAERGHGGTEARSGPLRREAGGSNLCGQKTRSLPRHRPKEGLRILLCSIRRNRRQPRPSDPGQGMFRYRTAVSAVRIVPWQPTHQISLVEMLDVPDDLTRQFRDLHGPDVAGPHWRRTLVAETGSRAVGAATVFASRWHPTRLWLGLEVAPAQRRCGIGTALLEAARDLADRGGRPLRAKVFANSPGALFAAAEGFHLLQRSRTFRLRQDGTPAMTDPRFRVDTSAPPDVVAEAFLALYLRIHGWDPPGEISADDVRTAHVDPAAAMLLVRAADGSVGAVGCLYDEPDGLLLSGGATSGAKQADAAAGALLDAAAAQAITLGRELLVEADDAAAEMVDQLDGRGAIVVDEVHVVAEA
jgi:GNAT superfamily N-acetyltransferase